MTKQNMRFVPIKTLEQLDVQAMHRVRDRLVQRRTALINEDAEQNLSPRLRWLLDRLWQEWKQTEVDIETVTDEIERISNEDERCRRLRQIPGFGPLVSTATVATIGNGAAFRRGRDFAAWVGVVPRQYSTGGKQKLFSMSKRGNIYLCRMLIHGARAVLFRVKYNTGGLGQWIHPLKSASSAQQSGSRDRQQTLPGRLAAIGLSLGFAGQPLRGGFDFVPTRCPRFRNKLQRLSPVIVRSIERILQWSPFTDCVVFVFRAFSRTSAAHFRNVSPINSRLEPGAVTDALYTASNFSTFKDLTLGLSA